MSWLKDKIKFAAELLDNDITLSEKEFRLLYHDLGDSDSADAEYLVDQMDLVKDTRIIPLHIAQHIYEVIES